MADGAILYAIDNAGPNADGSYNVVAQTYCQRITVQEDFDSTTAPTQDLRIKLPASAVNFVKVAKGTAAIFTALGIGRGFSPGQIVGSIKTAAGAITVQQVESQSI